MSTGGRRLSERIGDPTYLEGLADKPIDELRAMREECREAENEASFERRLCQGRIEILRAEIERRGGGEGAGDLIARLPKILGGERAQSEGPLPARAPNFSIPRSADVARRRVEEIVGEQTLARLPEIDDEELRQIVESLIEYEADLSKRRKDVQTVMDSVQEEIVRRYASGEADPQTAFS